MKPDPVDSSNEAIEVFHPRLVIGIPIYNEARYLAECLESVRLQSDPDFRVLLADNASSDGSVAVCEAMARRDKRFKLVKHPVNRGAVANFNFLRRASGSPYFAWVGAHDVLGVDYVFTHTRALECHLGAAVSFSYFAWIDEFADRLPDSAPVGLGDIRGPGWWRYLWSLTSGDVSAIHGVFRRSCLPSVDFESIAGCDHVILSGALNHGWALASLRRHYLRRDMRRLDRPDYMERLTGAPSATKDPVALLGAHSRLIDSFALDSMSHDALTRAADALLRAAWITHPTPLWYRLGVYNVWQGRRARYRISSALRACLEAR